MVSDGAIAAEEDRQNGHDNETAVRNRHPLGCRRHSRGRRIMVRREVFARLSHDLVSRACHLEYVDTTTPPYTARQTRHATNMRGTRTDFYITRLQTPLYGRIPIFTARAAIM